MCDTYYHYMIIYDQVSGALATLFSKVWVQVKFCFFWVRLYFLNVTYYESSAGQRLKKFNHMTFLLIVMLWAKCNNDIKSSLLCMFIFLLLYEHLFLTFLILFNFFILICTVVYSYIFT